MMQRQYLLNGERLFWEMPSVPVPMVGDVVCKKNVRYEVISLVHDYDDYSIRISLKKLG
jgi:hypothetical protein